MTKEYEKLMKSETLLKTIKEVQAQRLFKPFDISKVMRVRYVTTPRPTYPYFSFRSKGMGIPDQK